MFQRFTGPIDMSDFRVALLSGGAVALKGYGVVLNLRGAMAAAKAPPVVDNAAEAADVFGANETASVQEVATVRSPEKLDQKTSQSVGDVAMMKGMKEELKEFQGFIVDQMLVVLNRVDVLEGKFFRLEGRVEKAFQEMERKK